MQAKNYFTKIIQNNYLERSPNKELENTFPISIEPPNFNCSAILNGQKREKSVFCMSYQLVSKFKNDIDGAIKYLYDEMNKSRPFLRQTTESIITFEQILQSIDLSIRCGYNYFPFNSYQQYHFVRWNDAYQQYQKMYKVHDIYPEVFYYHHGLRFAHPKVREYVRHRDIFDMGAYCGDSMLVFLNYTDKTIFSYEYSPENCELIKKAIKENNVPESKVKLFMKGISDERKMIKTKSIERSDSHIQQSEEGKEIELTTIDYEVEKEKMKVGLIKGDIEGFELKALLGAQKTLREQRPVIAISLYHHTDEFFGIPAMIRNLPNYEFEFIVGTFWNQLTLYELALFAYPKEILEQ